MTSGASDAPETPAEVRFARVAFLYHPSVPRAEEVVERLSAVAERCGSQVRVEPMHEVDGSAVERLLETDLAVCVGGDGTVLHASSFAAQAGTPIFGVRMGRLGFLTETIESESERDLERVLTSKVRLERRSLVQAQVDGGEVMHGLNDVVIGRATLGRTISVGAHIDGVTLAEYRADAVIVATATGSTGYSLSVGGPILHPTSAELIVAPVAPHLTRANSLVLPVGSELRLSVERGYEAVLSVDGIQHRPLESGSQVMVQQSPRSVTFVRLGGPNEFYNSLARRLGWLRLDHVIDEGGSEDGDGSEWGDGVQR